MSTMGKKTAGVEDGTGMNSDSTLVMSSVDPSTDSHQGNGILSSNFVDHNDEIDVLKARLSTQSLDSCDSDDIDSSEHCNYSSSCWRNSDENTDTDQLSELNNIHYRSDRSDKSDSLCQSTETLIDHLDSNTMVRNLEFDSNNGGPSGETVSLPSLERMRNHSGPTSSTENKVSNGNEFTIATSLHSGLVISPASLTQDVPVNMGQDNKRISTVLESLDLQLLYIPKTQQLVAGRLKNNATTKNGVNTENTSCGGSEMSESLSDVKDQAIKPQSLKLNDGSSDSSLRTPTKVVREMESSKQPGQVLTPGSLDEYSSLCETDFLIKVQEVDQMTCDSFDMDCNFPRINTNESLLRTFTDVSSLSSISTGTDFSVSAASLDEGDGTGFCIDTGDAGFMEINLHSRNSFERSKNPSQDSGFEDKLSKPKRKGISSFLSRNLFSRKPKENNAECEDTTAGWKLFGKVPPKQVPTKDPDQILCEYQAKQRVSQAVGGKSKKGELEVMSTTALIFENRPMNLPSKSPEEAEKHRLQYEAMVEAAKRKEQKELKQKKKQKQQQMKQEDQQRAAARTWSNEILPSWDTVKNTKKVRDMWWYGIPTNIRGKVWKLAFGNDLNITQELYEICVSRAEGRIKMMDESPEVYGTSETSSEPPSSKESSVELIKLDVSRTFPPLCIFQKGGPYHDLLHSLLGAYACYRPDVGYVQGMSFIAAVLLLNMEVADAFICFANLLNRPCQVAFFRLDEGMMKSYFQTYDEFLIENMPALHKHFTKNKYTTDLYLIDWIFTLFSKSFPLDIACRVWDIFCRDGELFLFRTALGVLRMYEELLMNMDFIHLAQYLTKLPENMCQEKLFKCIETIRMSIEKKKFAQILASNIETKDNT